MSDSGETKTDTIYLTAATLASVVGRVVRPDRKKLTKVAKLNRKLSRPRTGVRRFSGGGGW